MPNRIELSPAFISNSAGTLTNRIMSTIGDNLPNHISSGGLLAGPLNTPYRWNQTMDNSYFAGGSVLTIMKGTPPISISQISPTMTHQETLNRISDTCLAFEPTYGHFSSSQYQVNPVSISTIFIPAIASGTATWFWLRRWMVQYTEKQLTQSVIGTVGLLGSGADLEMADVNILSGDNYRISAMKLEFPSSWEF